MRKLNLKKFNSKRFFFCSITQKLQEIVGIIRKTRFHYISEKMIQFFFIY